MSSFAATITSGGLSRPARIASVTDAPSSRWKLAVCSATKTYLSDIEVEHVVHALVAVDRRAGAGLTLKVDDGRAVREQLHDQPGLRLATDHVVRADMGEDALHALDPAVDGDDWHARLHGRVERRGHGD